MNMCIMSSHVYYSVENGVKHQLINQSHVYYVITCG